MSSERVSLPDLPKPDLMDQSPTTASDAPLEILQHIFVLDAYSHEAYYSLRPGAKHPALRLAHVSRRWRAAALGTSALWSRLEIDVSSSYFRRGTTQDPDATAASWRWRPALNQYLELAQNFPLHISLTFAASMTQGDDKGLRDVVSGLLHTAPRWRSLSLVCRPDCSDNDWSFLEPLHDRLDSLEELTFLVCSIGDDIQLSLSRCTVFRNAPKLTTAYIIAENGVIVELPWSRLVSATFSVNGEGDKAPMVHDFLVGLQEADQLKRLNFTEFYEDSDVPVLDRPILVALPRLEEITILAWSQVGNWLTVPLLSKLRVVESKRNLEDTPVLSPHFIESLVVRSKCNIISLTISNALGSRTVDGLQSIVYHLPQLASLRLEQDLWVEPRRGSTLDFRPVPPCDIAMGVFSFLTKAPSDCYSPFSSLQNVSLQTRIEVLFLNDLFDIFPSLSAMLASRPPLDPVPARVWTHMRIYRSTEKEKSVYGHIQGHHERFTKVEEDARWQMLTSEYRGQLNVLIEIIGRSTYDYQVWLGRTPEPGNL